MLSQKCHYYFLIIVAQLLTYIVSYFPVHQLLISRNFSTFPIKACPILILTVVGWFDPHKVAWFLRWVEWGLQLMIEWLLSASYLQSNFILFTFWAILGRSGYQLVAQMCWCRACLVCLCVSYRLLIDLKCECISQLWQGWDRIYLKGWS